MSVHRRLSIVLFVVAVPLFAHGDELPFRGIVTDPIRKPFSVRAAPPVADLTSYQLGDFACAVYPGATLFVTDQRQIANGEMWYFVQIDRPNPSLPTPAPRPTECAAGVTGWMIGRLKSGIPVVAVLQSGAKPLPGTASVAPRQAASVQTGGEGKPQGGFEPQGFISLYVVLAIGIAFGAIFAAWEKQGAVTKVVFSTPLVIIEILLLMFASVTLMVLFVPEYFAIDGSSVNSLLLQKVTHSHFGNLVIGFIFAILAMKAIRPK